jgi:hypothetical protein
MRIFRKSIMLPKRRAALEGTIDLQPIHPVNSGITTGRAAGIPAW